MPEIKIKHNRKAISAKKRFEIFKRDNFVCQYCGQHPPTTILHLDHIIPVKLGGDNHINNLITSCEKCNLGKGATPLTNRHKSLNDKAAEALEIEKQIIGYQKIMQAKRERIENNAWEIVKVFNGKNSIRRDWFNSIKVFNEKLGLYCVIDAMEIAVSKQKSETQTFKYFCGICWNKIKELHNGTSEKY